MKEPLRPAFGDYVRALPHLITGTEYAQSNGLMYELADRELAFIAQFAIPIALYYLLSYSPFLISNYRVFNLWNIISLGIALLAAYWFAFVYRFAAFRTRGEYIDWLDSLSADEAKAQPEEPKQPLKRRRIKSVFAFVVLLAVITGLMLIYCLVGRGQSVDRFYSAHKEQLNRLAGLTQKYEDFTADFMDAVPYIYESRDGKNIPENEKEEITGVLNSFGSNELYIYLIMGEAGKLDFSICDRWDDHYELQWCSFVVPEPMGDETYDSLFVVKTDLKKLDDHWRYFREYYMFF